MTRQESKERIIKILAYNLEIDFVLADYIAGKIDTEVVVAAVDAAISDCVPFMYMDTKSGG